MYSSKITKLSEPLILQKHGWQFTAGPQSGHVFSMLSLQSNSGAGQKRPQAGHDMSVKNAI